MQNVVLVIHLILALCLIGVVLLQRSEGGGLGMGGGGGGVVTGRQAATALSKLTWLFAVLFLCTSMTLTVLAARKSSGQSVVEQIGGAPTAPAQPAAPAVPDTGKVPAAKDLLPPSPSDAPATPPRAN